MKAWKKKYQYNATCQRTIEYNQNSVESNDFSWNGWETEFNLNTKIFLKSTDPTKQQWNFDGKVGIQYNSY